MTTAPALETPSRWTFPRRAVAGFGAAMTAIVWTHGLAALLRQVAQDGAPLASAELTIGALVVALSGVSALPRRFAAVAAAGIGVIAATAIEIGAPGSGVAALALVPVGAGVTIGARWLGRRLPASVDAVTTRRPALALVWALLALASVVQIGRLATHVTDREIPFLLTTTHPFWYKHECIGAYLYGAELALRGEENIYHAKHYPGLDAEAKPESRLEGVALEDPYQYPPHFLLLPRLALALTDDVATLRVAWFALQVTLFAFVAAALGLFAGGRAGQAALWASPFVMMSFPALHNFQFGQFHLPAIALALLAMLAFSRRRMALGGALLAAAILAKIFPAVLIAYLAAQRRFRELGWVALFAVVITVIAFLALGAAPFEAFVDYHLPRLGDGTAFAFEDAWPELTELVIADNQGVVGLARKLGFERATAATIGRLFAVLVFATAALVGLRRREAPRIWRAASWLSLLGLASLASPGAWGDYVPVAAVWLLALLAGPLTATRPRIAFFAIAAVFQFFVLGTMPLGSWAPYGPMLALSSIGVVIMLALFGGTLAVRAVDVREHLSALPEPSRFERTIPVIEAR